MFAVRLWAGTCQPLLGPGSDQVEVSLPGAFAGGKLEGGAVGSCERACLAYRSEARK